MYYFYVLKNESDSSLYKGITNNLNKRLFEHNQGLGKSTASKRPYKLVYSEGYKTRNEARQREVYFKSGCGREQLKKII